MKNSIYKSALFILIFTFLIKNVSAQERMVKVDFQASSFTNSPSLPFDKPFLIEGEVFRDVEFVEVMIYNAKSDKPINNYLWNRAEKNKSETFSIVVPEILRSNSKYDFDVVTYKLMTDEQKSTLKSNLASRISFYLKSHYQFDGAGVSIDKPKNVFKGLQEIIDTELAHYKSKNGFTYPKSSKLVLNEIKKQRNFKFKRFLKSRNAQVRDSIATKLLDEKVEHLTGLIVSEINPFLSSNLVQLFNNIKIQSVPSDKESFTLPVNAGLYAWKTIIDVDNASVKNTDFTLGFGTSIPFSRKTTHKKKNFLDSFSFSMGVLKDPVRNADGTKLVTPAINLPIYTGLGMRVFKVVRLNAAVMVVGEKGLQDFKNLSVVPTLGLALELNLWMGIKK